LGAIGTKGNRIDPPKCLVEAGLEKIGMGKIHLTDDSLLQIGLANRQVRKIPTSQIDLEIIAKINQIASPFNVYKYLVLGWRKLVFNSSGF
jgi:hypothetical protein